MTQDTSTWERALARRFFVWIGLFYILLFVPIVGHDLWSGRAQISQGRGKPNLIYERDQQPAAYWAAVRHTAAWGFGGGLALMAVGQLMVWVNRPARILKVWNAGRTTCRQKGPSRLVVGGFAWVQVVALSFLTVSAVRMAVNEGKSDLLSRVTSILLATMVALSLARSAERTRFVFDRELGICRWRRIGWYGIRWGAWPLAAMRGAVVETLEPSGANHRICRLTLRTPDGEVPVGSTYQWHANEDLAEIAQKIDRFLAGQA